jgi:hypothetical protein
VSGRERINRPASTKGAAPGPVDASGDACCCRWSPDCRSSANRLILEQPTWPFDESTLEDNIMHRPNAWLRRIS